MIFYPGGNKGLVDMCLLDEITCAVKNIKTKLKKRYFGPEDIPWIILKVKLKDIYEGIDINPICGFYLLINLFICF